MVKDLIGYRFCPTGEELIIFSPKSYNFHGIFKSKMQVPSILRGSIRVYFTKNHYLKNKNLGKTWLVDEAISEINICSFKPKFLPKLAKIHSKDPIWYFFSRIEFTSVKKTSTKRNTGSGFWKHTGKDRKIRDKRGNGVEIGLKKTLVYHEGKIPNGARTPWVMHEYHITCLPLPQRNYVLCQVMYRGEDGDILYGNNLSEPSQSLVSADSNTAPEFEQPGQENLFGMSADDLMIPMNEQEDLSPWDVFDPDMFFSDNNNPTVQPQAPHLDPNDDEFLGGLRHVDRGQVEYLFANEEFISTPNTSMQENRNDHRPRKPLTGIIVDYSSDSDSDAESIFATSYKGTSSPGDSVGSSNRHFLQTSGDEILSLSNDKQTSVEPFISRKSRESQLARCTIPSKQEVKQGIVKTEKKGLFITQEAIERKRENPPYIYLINMIIGFIVLLALIGDIISVYN